MEDWDSDTFNSASASTSVSVYGQAPPGKVDNDDISCSIHEDTNNADDAAEDSYHKAMKKTMESMLHLTTLTATHAHPASLAPFLPLPVSLQNQA